ncbi:hypothetical protein N7449_003940 [Penicillium cf. viridicatum]|uniref:Uncharacterized protein n=1 Tax=Penicillium cf. viridicatum TaxID=2972119 RepID=A0A9W9MXU9_9EURO|nr:hypothetical protein N7449_003940 [Penicillium cf. viridicatum]
MSVSKEYETNGANPYLLIKAIGVAAVLAVIGIASILDTCNSEPNPEPRFVIQLSALAGTQINNSLGSIFNVSLEFFMGCFRPFLFLRTIQCIDPTIGSDRNGLSFEVRL